MENQTTGGTAEVSAAKSFVVTEDLHATAGQRFVNYLIDLVMVYAIIFALGVLLGLLAVLLDNMAIVDWFTDSNTLKDYLILFSIWIPYYTLFEKLSSRTVGKFVTKTMVVNEDGSPISFETAFKRTLCRIIPFEAFSFFGSGARGWHDSIPDTYVVQKEAFLQKRNLFYDFEQIGSQLEEA